MLLWLAALLLLGWVFSQIPLGGVFQTLGRLEGWQLITFAALNTLITVLLGMRWWLLLRRLGYRISLLTITRYRLAAFGVSYFTPGPQFGGEPLQVYFVNKYHDVPLTDSLAALSMDKLLDLLANFTFLIFGLIVLGFQRTFSGIFLPSSLLIIILIWLIPVFYLWLIRNGSLPVSRLLTFIINHLKLGGKWNKAITVTQEAEQQMGTFIRKYPRTFLKAVFLSFIIWSGFVFEYWLGLSFLGAQINLWQTITVITIARLAMLTPLPAAIGALEGSQLLAMQVIGLPPSLGVSHSLLIRVRDVTFGGLGLWLNRAEWKRFMRR